MKKFFSKLLVTLGVVVAGLTCSSAAHAGWGAVCPYNTTSQCAGWLYNPWQIANSAGWHFSGQVAGGYHTVDITVLPSMPQIQISLDGYYYGTFSTQLVGASMEDNSFGSIVDHDEVMRFNVIVGGTVFPVSLKAAMHGVSSVSPVRVGACVTISNSTSCREI